MDELVVVYKDWIIKWKKVIKFLKEIVKDMDSDEFKNNVINIVGGGVGIVSGVMMIGGLLLVLFIVGFGFVLVGVGVGVGVVGGIGNLVGDVIFKNYVLKKCKEVDDLI